MLDIRLTVQDAEMLRKILESYLSDLRAEIAGTDSKDLRDALKEEEVFIKGLLRRLPVEDVRVTV
ncbi:hypothetical protein ANRL4_04544 [Anaerolineae bacterium]|nr:hypothetical protein ANRL4_04544 [Anaerolineae bacterium]